MVAFRKAFHENNFYKSRNYFINFPSCIVISILMFISCKKNDFPPHDDFYLQMRVNGKARTFYQCAGFPGGTGGGQFECDRLGDTALFIVAGCGGYASFLINSPVNNGIYLLNRHNSAEVSVANTAYNSYTTDSTHTGTLTIKKVLFKNSNCLQGNFSYTGIDTSGAIGTITEGSFLMPIGS